jgi:RNA polymerase sigma factor (sigma-70 family)
MALDGSGSEVEGPGSQPDRVLVARLVAGEPEGLAEAYRRYAGLVFGLSRRVLNDEAMAEDVTQEVFVFLWQHPDRFDPVRGSLRNWLGLLAHHRSVDRVRAESRRVSRDALSAVDQPLPSEIDDCLNATWLSDRVRQALDQLAPEQREAIELAYFGDRTYRQVAIELGLPEGTVKSRMRGALRRLDTILRADLSEEAPAWS